MKWNKEKSITLLYLAIYLIAALTIALHQPLNDTPPSFCNPPDEHSRYKVPVYICEHGTLPTGFEEELLSADCKWTYGFYTLLPYMVQGYAMRFVDLFTDSSLALLYTARLVNVFFGFLMAIVVLQIGKKLFKEERVRWLFCFLVTFLPQSLFLHTYVNPDSLCLLSTALMCYGLLLGYGDGFSVKACLLLSAGVILCALSYYNAYGFIISSILLFTAYFFKKEDGRLSFDWKSFLKKGIGIAVLVLLCISWSFIRNYVLYDGDFIGLETKENFIKAHGILRETYESQGKSLFSMLFGTTFFFKLAISFIANYGSATLYTWIVVYVFYLLLFAAGILGTVFCREKGRHEKEKTEQERKEQYRKERHCSSRWLRIFFHANMVFCILMPFILTVKYAYTVDYQAQGRYIMPGLLPLMYYVCRGLHRLPVWQKAGERLKNRVYVGIMAGIILSLLITVYVTALPCYLQTAVL